MVSPLISSHLRFELAYPPFPPLLCRCIIRNEPIISLSSYFSPPPHPNPRTHLPHTVHVPFARTASSQSSYFVSVCNLWNSLPEEVVSLPSSCSFKAALLQRPSFSLKMFSEKIKMSPANAIYARQIYGSTNTAIKSGRVTAWKVIMTVSKGAGAVSKQ